MEDVNRDKYHELCIYFLIDISKTDLCARGETFIFYEGIHTHIFEWLELERLKSEYFYPNFIKEKISDLPEQFTLLTEYN